MDRWIRFSGILGLVLFLFGLVGSLIVQGPGGLFQESFLVIHMIVGLLLLFFWVINFGIKGLASAGGVLTGRKSRLGANALLYIVVFVGIIIAVNWLAFRHNKRWDLTEQGVYSLSPESRKVIQDLQKPLKIVGFKVQENPQALNDIIELYKTENPAKVDTSVVDPRAKFNLVEQYEMKQGNVIYIEYGEGKKKGISRVNDASEETITNAIVKLTRGDAKKVYYVIGHGEPDVKAEGGTGALENSATMFGQFLQDEHVQVDTLLLGRQEKVPDDAAAVILVAPKKPLLPQERDLLVQYAENGGRLLLFHDPRTTTDIKDIASKFGIAVGDDIIVDQQVRLFAGPSLGVQPIAQTYSLHPITKSFNQETVTVYNLASSVTAANSKPSDNSKTWVELVKTSPTSWAEKNLAAIFDSSEPTAQKDADDIQGPVSIAASYENQIKGEGDAKSTKATRVVVFGDSDFIRNGSIGRFYNRDLVLNAVNWLSGEEGGLSIRPRSMRASAAPIRSDTYKTILAGSFAIIELILILGLLVWWSRKEVFA